MGNLKRVILVLEDMEVRMTWLYKTFPGVDIRWCKNVLALVTQLNTLEEQNSVPYLVILDHDLGEGSTATGLSLDDNGNDGRDAARMIHPECPVLVWSANPPAAIQMRQILVDKGVTCVYIPYRTSNLAQIGALISRCL